MTTAQRVDRIDYIGRGILGYLDDLKRAECPRCGQQSLEIEVAFSGVTLTCDAPSEKRTRTSEGQCGYRRVALAVTTRELPELVFAEKPARAPRRRRRAS
jgi:hypothetical protein